MANQHFVIDLQKPHGRKLAELVAACGSVIAIAGNLKSVADEVTDGGTTLDAAGFLTLFGLPDADAGAATYPLLQSIMAGTLTQASFVELDQGL